jgi:uncharacterized membrane protein YdjX (TVP38/TMEM64 family)
MSADRPPPSELVYLPGPSWAPAALAVGLAAALVGAFAGWVYSALGGIIAVIAFWVWVRQAGAEIARLPAEQTLDTAVLPPESVRRANGG